MSAGGFHDQPFDDGTLTKLRIFGDYTRHWLPVFLSQPLPRWKRLHLFDFFAGPGADSQGIAGSPLLLLNELANAKQHYQGWNKVQVTIHLYDEDAEKIEQLRPRIHEVARAIPEVRIDIQAWDFDGAYDCAKPVLADADVAKLVFVDQFGVKNVSDAVFRELTSYRTCDVLFFLASSTLHRFHDHPAIAQRIVRPTDYYHVHRAAVDYYRSLLSTGSRYFLGHFSIKKGSNIYGLVFGSAHPLGMDKFITTAWNADPINGEANFDINRDDCGPLLNLLSGPRKLDAFQADLRRGLLSGAIQNEADVIEECFSFGMKRQHAESVLREMKKEGLIALDFRVPDIDRWKTPRAIARTGPRL